MKPTIFHVNDSSCLMELFREEFSDIFTIREFTDFYEAIQSEGKCDLLVIDLTTVSSPFHGITGIYGFFVRWIAKRPHCPIVIWTAMPPDWTLELIGELEKCDVDLPSIKHVTLSAGCLEDSRKTFLEILNGKLSNEQASFKD